jgi:hypothetical protein
VAPIYATSLQQEDPVKKRAMTVFMTLLMLCSVGTLLSCDCLCSKDAAKPAAPAVPGTPAPVKPGETWHFAVSGDSRNCGDVVMPAIAQGANHDAAKFYWHLGDLRAIYDFDQDMQQDYKRRGQHLNILDYEKNAWKDFRAQQTVPFGGIPFFLGIGNHETIEDFETRAGFVTTFKDFLDMPQLQEQRDADKLKDKKRDFSIQTYYHWKVDGIDFIYLDNASGKYVVHEPKEFDAAQMDWFHWVLNQDRADASIHTVIVGMHAALPNSISAGHSMNEWPEGTTTGTQVYQDLLKLQNDSKKKVYVLASHSHYYMEDIFNTQYWRTNGGVLPGWIVGTAGAVRYPLPEPNSAKVAKTNVYGYLLGTVNQGAVTFEFKQLAEKDVPAATVHGYTQEFVHDCFENNSEAKGGPAER